MVRTEPNPKCGCKFECNCNSSIDPNILRQQQCACADICPPCPAQIQSMKTVHEQAANVAQQDGQAEETLARQSELQAKLFILAQKYARDTLEEEKNSRRLAIELQESSSRAQIARNKMQRAVFQAQQLALKTAQQYKQIFSNFNFNQNINPIQNAQVMNNMQNTMNTMNNMNTVQNTMQNIQNIQNNNNPGMIENLVKMSNNRNAPESIEEAQTQAEVELSRDLQMNSLQDLQQWSQ